MKVWIIAIVALAFAASANAGGAAKKAADAPPSPFDNVYRDATAEEIEAVREAMQDRLKDADSAKFRNVYAIGSIPSICGEVNAKNSMGAYSGYSAFSGVLIRNQTDHVVNGVAPGKSSAVVFLIDEEGMSVVKDSCRKQVGR